MLPGFHDSFNEFRPDSRTVSQLRRTAERSILLEVRAACDSRLSYAPRTRRRHMGGAERLRRAGRTDLPVADAPARRPDARGARGAPRAVRVAGARLPGR